MCLVSLKDDANSFRNHLRSAHPGAAAAVIQCRVCKFLFSGEDKLRRHKKESEWHQRETKRQQVVCHQCGRKVLAR